MKSKKNYSRVSSLVAVTLLALVIPARAVSPQTTCVYQQLSLPPVLATNSTLAFSAPVFTNYVTNADNSVYSNTVAPYFIDASKERYVALEFKESSGVANGYAGVSNAIYTLAPVVYGQTNAITLPIPINATSTNVMAGLSFDTNHLITISVPLSATAGATQTFVTNLDGAGLAGWYVLSTSNQVKNGLVTNAVFAGYKAFAP